MSFLSATAPDPSGVSLAMGRLCPQIFEHGDGAATCKYTGADTCLTLVTHPWEGTKSTHLLAQPRHGRSPSSRSCLQGRSKTARSGPDEKLQHMCRTNVPDQTARTRKSQPAATMAATRYRVSPDLLGAKTEASGHALLHSGPASATALRSSDSSALSPISELRLRCCSDAILNSCVIRPDFYAVTVIDPRPKRPTTAPAPLAPRLSAQSCFDASSTMLNRSSHRSASQAASLLDRTWRILQLRHLMSDNAHTAQDG